MQIQLSLVCIVVVLLATVVSTFGEELRVLPTDIDGAPARATLERYLLRQVDEAWTRWQDQYEKLETPAQITAYQKRRKAFFVDAVGGLPERTPLKPRITGVVQRKGFRVEKVIFESQPRHYVTAGLFLPDPTRYKPPYPGVLVPCGHSANGKASDAYQRASALLALNGMAALLYDPIDQGERGQLLNDKGKPAFRGVSGHDMVGIGCVLLGRNTARFRIWDGMRAIDYLQSRPEVDPKRIGCTGNSGGGTMTSYLMALDERIVAAAPSCYLTNLPTLIRTIGPQDAEQNIHGQLAFGMDHPDYILMRAPKPTLICAATSDFFDIGGTWETFRYAKRLYTRMGFAERIDLIENDEKHGFNKLLREGAVRWMMRWLLAKGEPITEPAVEVLGDREIECTPKGQVMLLDGARSVYDLNEDYEKVLAERRRQRWAGTDATKLLAEVRRIAGIRPLAELPAPKADKVGVVKRDGYRIEKLVLSPEEDVPLPALMFVPEGSKGGEVTLYLHEKGKASEAKPGGEIDKLVRAGRRVLAADVRGVGPTALKNWRQMNTPYLLGRSLLGMRAEDVLVCARYAVGAGEGGVDLMAIGHLGVPALHAAALEPSLFRSVTLRGTLASWSSVVHARRTHNQWVNAVHGALAVYDLPNLAAMLGDKLTIAAPVDARAKPIKAK